MDEEKLRKILKELKEETKGMTNEEKEATYRLKFMKDSKLINLITQQHMVGGGGEATPLKRTSSISLRRFATLIRLIKGKKALKIGHAGILPFKIELPQKNLNTLQTKLEKLVTEETKLLTAEQQEQRAQYAKYMKKEDSEELINEIEKYAELIVDNNTPNNAVDEIINYLTPFEMKDNIWVDSGVEFGKINTGMNNIIKVPIILAKEGIQEYQFREEDGSIRKELHLKSYPELKKAVRGLDVLHMIIEHKDSWNYGDTVGCVRQIVADDKNRNIRGTGYFKKDNIPKYLLDTLIAELPFAVSIGFLAEKGKGGEFEGKIYDYIQKNIQLDHLAICIDSTPRCSLPDCGGNVEKFEAKDNLEFTIIKKNNYYYNINKIIFDSKETIEKKPQEEIIGEKQHMVTTEDAKPDKPEDQEEMLGKLKAWLEAMHPDKKSSLKDEIIKLFGDSKKMDEKEYVDALKEKDSEYSKLSDKFRRIYTKEIKSFSDKFTDAKLDAMSLEKLEMLADLVSDPDVRKEKKAEVLPMEGKDKKDEEQKDKPKRIDPAEVFSDTNKEFIMDSFIASNFGRSKQ